MSNTWEVVPKRKFPKLKENISVDVLIIGGGITGVLNAYYLAKAGKRVALIEQDEIGGNATLMTTAFITAVPDTSISKLSDIFGKLNAKLIWESGMKAVDELERIITEEEIQCEFMRCPAYVFAVTKKQGEIMKKDFDTLNILGVEVLMHIEKKELGFYSLGGHMKVPEQAKFHPGIFLSGLAEKAEFYGAEIYEKSRAISVTGNGPITIKTSLSEITAKEVVIATYKPLIDDSTAFKKGMYVSYVIEAEMPTTLLGEAIYWDLDNPYHYFRIDRREDRDRIILGGEDHREEIPGLKRKSFSALEEFLNKIIKTQYKIKNKWTGPIIETADGIALIGSIKPNYYVATGFSGNGMTYSAISAMIIRDLILKNENPWIELYDPKRIPTIRQLAVKGRDYMEEFFGSAVKNMLR